MARKKLTVNVCLSYLYDKKLKNSIYTLSTENLSELFDNLMYDAQRLADNLQGKIYFHRDAKSLYISYLDVPCTDKIDVIYSL